MGSEDIPKYRDVDMADFRSYGFTCVVLGAFLLCAICGSLLSSDPRLERWPKPRSSNHLALDESIITTLTSPTSNDNINTTGASSSAAAELTAPVQNCTVWKPIVFIKTHKTGSTTLQTIVNRFGLFHNLSFVFNRRSSYNGHFYFLPVTAASPQKYFLPPIHVRQGDYKNYKNYDMLAVHVRYNRSAMDAFMRNGTKYITIIREPSSQWESAFEHFMFQEAFKNSSKIPKERWLGEFLSRPSYYREKLRFLKYENVMGRRWYYAQNNLMYDLGLDPEMGFYNETTINATIKRLDMEFTLILLTEYFDESLLVLKKELCWEYEDIVYFPKNQREARRNISEEIRDKIRKWNNADTLLYHHFNKTLWRKIQEYGRSFEADLVYFRELNLHLFTECGNDKPTISRLGKHRLYKHVEFSPRKNATLFCRTIAESKKQLFDRVYHRQNPFVKPISKSTRARKPAVKGKGPLVVSSHHIQQTSKTRVRDPRIINRIAHANQVLAEQKNQILAEHNAKVKSLQVVRTGSKDSKT